MTSQEKRDLVDRYIAAYNAFDVDGMTTVLHPEIYFRNIAGGQVTATAAGVEEFRSLAERSQAWFASRHQEVTSFDEDGDLATVGIRYAGVLAADLPNGMSAGETISLDGRSEFGFRDGRIDRITDYS